jgi:hypothetical protein
MKQDERTPGLDDDETLVRRWSEWAKTARRGGPIVVDRSILLRGIELLEPTFPTRIILMTAQEDVAGMPTPGPWHQGNPHTWKIYGADGSDQEVAVCYGGTHVQSEANAAFIVKAVNAYTITEALREALADELVWHEAAEKALSKQPPSGDRGWRRAEHQERIDAIRAALSGSPAPSTEGLREWLPIETAPKPHEWLNHSGSFLLAKIWQSLDENGDADGDPEIIWSAVLYLTASGWMLPTSSVSGAHGYASFRVRDDATHWMPLPPAPDAARTALAGVTAPSEVDAK